MLKGGVKLKRISITLFIFLFVSIFSSPYSTQKAYAFFDQTEVSEAVNITVGSFELPVSEWDPSTNYQIGDQVTFDGNRYEANGGTQGDEPSGTNVGEFAQWRLIEATIDPIDDTHQFGEEVLNATITLDGVVVVENGTINTANAESIGVTVSKSSGNYFWEFDRNGRLRIRTNGDIQTAGNFTFDSIVVELP